MNDYRTGCTGRDDKRHDRLTVSCATTGDLEVKPDLGLVRYNRCHSVVHIDVEMWPGGGAVSCLATSDVDMGTVGRAGQTPIEVLEVKDYHRLLVGTGGIDHRPGTVGGFASGELQVRQSTAGIDRIATGVGRQGHRCQDEDRN